LAGNYHYACSCPNLPPSQGGCNTSVGLVSPTFYDATGCPCTTTVNLGGGGRGPFAVACCGYGGEIAAFPDLKSDLWTKGLESPHDPAKEPLLIKTGFDVKAERLKTVSFEDAFDKSKTNHVQLYYVQIGAGPRILYGQELHSKYKGKIKVDKAKPLDPSDPKIKKHQIIVDDVGQTFNVALVKD
jgi:hypothetical protein